MNVEAFLSELRREHELIEETIAVLERLLYAQSARRGRPPGRVKDLKAPDQSGKKTKLRRQGEHAATTRDE